MMLDCSTEESTPAVKLFSSVKMCNSFPETVEVGFRWQLAAAA
jgi:hypothetical protein